MKKYRFFTGQCGPTSLYSNIIRAHDEREAAIKYLGGNEQEISDVDIHRCLKNIVEIVTEEAPDQLLDVFGTVLVIGVPVVYIRNSRYSAPVFLKGTIKRMTGKSVEIDSEDGSVDKLILSAGTEGMILKILVMADRPQREGEPVDVTGYPIKVGDKVAYMDDIYTNSCKKLLPGTVEKISRDTVYLSKTRRKSNRMVVIA